MTSKTRIPLIAAAATLVAVAAGFILVAQRDADDPQSMRAGGGDIVVAQASDRLPNQTASDWVTYADYVVVVTATDDREIPAGQDEIDRGEGIIMRDVTLRVDDVLWSHRDLARPAPTTFSWTAFGWQFTDGSTDNRVPLVGEDTPRVESGHRYIMAIEWVAPQCSPGDPRTPGQWRGLGTSSTVPFDNGVIGNGESEGHLQTADQAVAAADPADPNYTLADATAGQDAAALTAKLNAAKPQQRQQFGPPPSSTSCD